MLQSKSWRERLWVLLAALSISLLVPEIGTTLDVWGIVAALIAGVFWGTYILTSPKVSAVSNGFSGLIASLWIAWLILLVPGIAQAQWQLLDSHVLWQSLLMGLAAAVIPFTCDISALQRLPARSYGVLVCTEPIAGAIIGYIVLQEALTPRIVLAILGVTVAAIGTTLFTPAHPAPPPQEA
jgi:inner membrane transporter RhtA